MDKKFIPSLHCLSITQRKSAGKEPHKFYDSMKRSIIFFSLIVGLIVFLSSGCQEPVRKKVLGVWLIEDIKVSGDTSLFDAEQFQYAIEGQKQIRVELKEDSLFTIYTGAAQIDGIWYYDKSLNQVMVTLEGNMEPTLLGIYENGKLINTETTPAGAIISTIFIKEVIEEEAANP